MQLPVRLSRKGAGASSTRRWRSSLGKAARPQVSLALQGGASFGAFTWGVLERLIEDDRWALDVISGTSAGALNACCWPAEFVEAGPAGARNRLEHFWTSLSKLAP